MINIKIPGTKDTVWAQKPADTPKYTPPGSPAHVYPMTRSLMDEATRRNEIVKHLYNTCNIRPGDTVFPNAEWAEVLGNKIRVVAIAKTYPELGKEAKWPDDDKPLMVHVYAEEKKEHFMVTTDMVVKHKAN